MFEPVGHCTLCRDRISPDLRDICSLPKDESIGDGGVKLNPFDMYALSPVNIVALDHFP